jgi:hypothetical protein
VRLNVPRKQNQVVLVDRKSHIRKAEGWRERLDTKNGWGHCPSQGQGVDRSNLP